MNDIDERLTEAGRRWREHPDVRAALDAAGGRTVRHNPGRGRWAAATTAAALVVVAAAAVTIAGHGPSGRHSAGSTGTRPAGLAGLVVHDGDRVQADGDISMSSTGEGRICADLPVALVGVGRMPGSGSSASSQPAQPCVYPIARLRHVPATGGATGPMRVVGTFRDGVIDVSDVHPSPQESTSDGLETPPPCATPAGGWRSPDGTSNLGSTERVSAVVNRNASTYGSIWVAYATDGPKLPYAEGGIGYIPVLVVGTTGDVAAARAQLTPLYPGPLCVHSVPHSTSDLRAARAQATSAFGDAATMSGDGLQTESFTVTRVTQQAADALADVQDLLTVTALLRPI